MARGEQTELAGFEQKRIPAIERAIMKADEKRAVIEGLKEELKNLEHKVREVLHENIEQLDHQENEEGGARIVYKRAGFEAELKGHERLSYGKVREKDQSEDDDAA